jgi:hypothetical protein
MSHPLDFDVRGVGSAHAVGDVQDRGARLRLLGNGIEGRAEPHVVATLTMSSLTTEVPLQGFHRVVFVMPFWFTDGYPVQPSTVAQYLTTSRDSPLSILPWPTRIDITVALE